MIGIGAAEGFVFDLFRVLRKNTCKSFAAVSISDVLYWIVAAVILIAALFHFTFGQLRGYLFVGIALGLIFYFLLISRWVIAFLMKLIAIILKIFKLIFKILLTPLTFLYKMLLASLVMFLGRFFKKIAVQIKMWFCEMKTRIGFKLKNLNFLRIWKPRDKNVKKTKQN